MATETAATKTTTKTSRGRRFTTVTEVVGGWTVSTLTVTNADGSTVTFDSTWS